jgi:hypothetical protein
MLNGLSGRGILLLAALGLFSSFAQAQASDEARCKEEPQFYADHHYKVRRVRIDTPLAWLFGAVKEQVEQILSAPGMPIKKDDPFRKHPYDAGHLFIKQNLPDLVAPPGTRLAAQVTYPSLANCDPKTQQLDVVYRVYAISFSGYLIRTFEVGRKDEVSRGVIKTEATKRLARNFVQPYAGYNGSRNLFGGTKYTAVVGSGLVEKLTLDAAGSSSSAEVRANASGSKEWDKGAIRYAEWAGEYHFYDVPGDPFRLKRGTVRAQFLAATRPFGADEFTLRFGGAVEGGNRQTEDNGRVLPVNAADTGHKSVKAFVGGDFVMGRHAFKVSYGAQFGNAGQGVKLDYVKQVFDAAANFRFVPWDRHNPLTLDTQFTAGAIHTRGTLPVAERFFGGNAERPFITGSSWAIRSEPFIRSFPENSFARTGVLGGVGGNRFFSANATLAATVWRRPLVPEEILNDCTTPEDEAQGDATASGGDDAPCVTIDELVEFQLGTAETLIKSAYLTETPKFVQIADKLDQLVAPLNGVREIICPYTADEKFRQLYCPNVPPDADPTIRAAVEKLYSPPVNDDSDAEEDERRPQGTFARVAIRLGEIRKQIKDEKANLLEIKRLVAGRSANQILPSYLDKMNDHLEELAAALPEPKKTRIMELHATIDSIGQSAAPLVLELGNSEEAKEAERKAARDMRYPRRVINELIHEANIISVSPVAMFDAARVWRSGAAGDVRYAAGGGVRVSLINFDVTTGYAWNVHRRPGEGRGAFVFTMDFSNLFR